MAYLPSQRNHQRQHQALREALWDPVKNAPLVSQQQRELISWKKRAVVTRKAIRTRQYQAEGQPRADTAPTLV